MIRVVFWSGLLAAALIIRGALVSDAHPERGEAAEEPPRHAFLSEGFLRTLTDHLKLSVEQQKKVKAALDKSRPDMEKVEADMKAAREKMRALAHKTKETIRETLDMAQKDKFDEMLVRMRHRMRHKMHGGRHVHEREIEIRERRGPGEAHEAPEKPDGPPPADKDEEEDD